MVYACKRSLDLATALLSRVNLKGSPVCDIAVLPQGKPMQRKTWLQLTFKSSMK